MKGFQLSDNCWRRNYETMVGYIRTKDAKGRQDPWPPLGFRAGEDLWRDSQALFQSVAEGSQRPRNISWVDELRQAGHLNRKQIQIDVSGMSASRAKVALWRHESLPVPLEYLNRAELIESLGRIIQLARDVKKGLLAAVRKAATTALKPGKDQGRVGKTERDAVEQMVKSLDTELLFWSRLERPFRNHLQELAGEDVDRSKIIYRWFTETLQPAATDAYRRTAGEMEDSSRGLRAAVSGEELLRRELGRIAAEYGFVTDAPRKEATHDAVGP
jgi:hypothetical protein